MATFTDDEFLVALDDLHAVDLGIKKLVAKMKELKPDWTEGITAKVVREAVAVIRAPDGAAAVAAARQRVGADIVPVYESSIDHPERSNYPERKIPRGSDAVLDRTRHSLRNDVLLRIKCVRYLVAALLLLLLLLLLLIAWRRLPVCLLLWS